jgi:nucleotide-binding universal stress UspA family protein
MKSKSDPDCGVVLAEGGGEIKRAAKAISAFKVCRILVPVDFSEVSTRALDYAVSAAAAFGSSVVLLHIVEPSRGGGRLGAEANEHGLEVARERLLGLSREYAGMGIDFEELVRMGLAHSEIADTANALGCDWIVMGTSGRNSQSSVVGSTADWVIHHAACPVVTLGRR